MRMKNSDYSKFINPTLDMHRKSRNENRFGLDFEFVLCRIKSEFSGEKKPCNGR